MKIQKNELLKKLEAVKPGLSNKEIIEFADSFSFNDGQLITYNDFICVKCPIETDIQGTIKAQHFYDILRQFKADKEGFISIEYSPENENELLISGSKSKAGLPINKEGKLSLDELTIGKVKWAILPANFKEGIKIAAFAVSKDASNAKLTCLNIANDVIEASDGLRAFKFNLESPIKEKFLLPAFVVPTLGQHSLTKYSITSNWIHFKTKENLVISCRMYQDQDFPDTSFLFVKGGTKILFPKQVQEALDRAIVFLAKEAEDKMVNIDIAKKGITISSKSEHGWFRELIISKMGRELSFEINPYFLQDILKRTNKAFMTEKNGFNLLNFRTPEWHHVINILIKDDSAK